MAPFPGDSPETPVWHLDAARGPSTPSFDHLVGAGKHRRRQLEGRVRWRSGSLRELSSWRNDHQDWRVVAHHRKLRGEAMIDNRIQVFDVAMKNARTIEACVDRLVTMGAEHELKLVAQRLSRLTFRLRHQPSKVRKGWEQPQSSAA